MLLNKFEMDIRCTFLKGYFLVAVNLLLLVGYSYGQQLPQFTQYTFNGLHVNPGYAGFGHKGYIQTTYRSQWSKVPGAPVTYTFTGDFALMNNHMGIGLVLFSDELGPLKTSVGLLAYNYRIKVSYDGFIGLGLSGGFTNYKQDIVKLQPLHPEDPQLPDGEPLIAPSLNSGLFYFDNQYFIGLSVYNLVGHERIQNSSEGLDLHNYHYYLITEGRFPVSKDVTFKPSILVKYYKNAPLNFDLSFLWRFYNKVSLGASYRSSLSYGEVRDSKGDINRSALAIIFEVFTAGNIRFGYAYDFNLGGNTSLRTGSHELSLGYYLFERKEVKWKSPRDI